MTSDGPVFTSPAPSQPRPTQLPLRFTSEARRPTRFAQVPAAPSATLARLDRGALLVYLHVALAGGSHAFSSRGVWITTGQLIERTGLSRDTVKRGRRQLRATGLLRYHPGSGRRPTVYRLMTGEEDLAAAAPYSRVAAEVLGMWKTAQAEGPGGGTGAPPGGAWVHPPRPLTPRSMTRGRQLTLFNNDQIDGLNGPTYETTSDTPGPGTPPGGAPMHPLPRRDENAHPR